MNGRQIGDVIHNFSAALDGRTGDVRELITRLDDFVGVLDAQRDNIVSTIQSLNRLSATFAGQRDVLTEALDKIPPAMDVLIKERPRFTTALQKLGTFGDTAHQFVNDSQDDLVTNLRNLEPALKALADVGPRLASIVEYAGHFPFTQSFMDRAIRGDYYNLFAVVDFTIPRLKHSMLLGTRWEQEDAALVPAPGDPQYQNYTYDPLKTGIAPPPPDGFGSPGAPPPPITAAVGPVLPIAPPASINIPGGPVQTDAAPPGAGGPAPIFAGPYGATPGSGG